MNTRPLLFCLPALVALGFTSTGPARAAETQCFTGYAYHLEDGEYAYSEHHEQSIIDGETESWKVTYRSPAGEIIARKTLDFSANPFVPLYQMNMPGSGYMEGIRREDGQWQMLRREGEDAALETEDFEPNDRMAADSGFHPFVVSRFDSLMQGDTVKFRFAVAGRQSVIKMKSRRIDDGRFEGRPTVRFETELDMFLVSFLVDSLVLAYHEQTRELKEYRGLGNMHDASGDPYPVRVSYYSEKPAEADRVSTNCGGA
ncbi:MAG: hypothetical protein CMN28_06180 [Salinisphaeraceae bacterium]|nr:hypothetical protein [Salinisphaeraceae bacterium]